MLQFLKTKQCNLASAKISNKLPLVHFSDSFTVEQILLLVTIHNQEDSAQANVKGQGKLRHSNAGIQEG
jgi:hypothetical protein